jgi:transposase
MNSKISILEFLERFDSDDKCLDYLFQLKFKPNEKGQLLCNECKSLQKFYKLEDRKCYSCSNCRHQLHPLAKTVFHKSATPLRKWFYAMYLMSVSKNGVAALELQRQLNVTYKCAWRIGHQLKKLLTQSQEMLSGNVEVDETYHGGKNINRHVNKKVKGAQGRSSKDKQPILGMLQRNGKVKAVVVSDTRSSVVMPILRKNISVGITLMTDEYRAYKSATKYGYKHEAVNHSMGSYVSGNAHTNKIENFWGQLKRSINGTYHCVSKKHLQAYVDEFSWRYNHRDSDQHLFDLMVRNV